MLLMEEQNEKLALENEKVEAAKLEAQATVFKTDMTRIMSIAMHLISMYLML